MLKNKVLLGVRSWLTPKFANTLFIDICVSAWRSCQRRIIINFWSVGGRVEGGGEQVLRISIWIWTLQCYFSIPVCKNAVWLCSCRHLLTICAGSSKHATWFLLIGNLPVGIPTWTYISDLVCGCTRPIATYWGCEFQHLVADDDAHHDEPNSTVCLYLIFIATAVTY